MSMSRFLASCSGLLLAFSLQAGTVLYNSTGQSSNGADSVQNFGPLYDSFSTGTNSGAISAVEFVLNVGVGTAPGSFSVDLFADSGTTSVGGLIGNLGTIDDSSLSTSLSLIALNLANHPDLAAGTRYWIGLTSIGTDPGTSASWSWTLDTSGTGVNGEWFQNSSGTFANNTGGGYQMDVEVGGGVPEPSTLLLGVSSLAAFAFLRRRAAK